MEVKKETIEEREKYKISTNGRYIIVEIKGVKKKFKNGLIIVKKIPIRNKEVDYELVRIAVQALHDSPSLIKLVLENESTMKLIKYIYAFHSKSHDTIKTYANAIKQFSLYCGKSPDAIIYSCLLSKGKAKVKSIKNLEEKVEEFLTEKEIKGGSRTTIITYRAALKTFFYVNEINISLKRRRGPKVTYRDRAPKPEEVQKLIEIVSLREKAIIAMLATGGFRINTLMKLKYKDVKEDLEAGRVPLHIHVPAEYNKGKVCDYDTFINEEATYYLRLYLEQRRKGTEKIPPEEINDDSPLFRTYEKEVRPLDKMTAIRAIRKAIRAAGLVNGRSVRYEVRIHSLRKFFRTQLVSLGVPTEYVEYMMGHKLSTYSDISMKGVEFLRQVYASANLRIKQEKKASLVDVLKEIIRSKGEDPSKYLKSE
ncbi:MAG: tyrosine-type recombinase/integrase, partial [Thermoproteota archaeon]